MFTIKQNIWDNWCVYLGRKKVFDSAHLDRCIDWVYENYTGAAIIIKH